MADSRSVAAALRVEVAETEPRRGQPVRVEVRALGPDYQPVGKVEVSLSLQRIAGTESGATSEPLAESVMSKTLHTDEEGVGSISGRSSRRRLPVIARAVIAGRPTDDSDVFWSAELAASWSARSRRPTPEAGQRNDGRRSQNPAIR